MNEIPRCAECTIQLTIWDTDLDHTCNACARALRKAWHLCEEEYFDYVETNQDF